MCQTGAIATVRNGQGEIPFDGLWIKVLVKHFRHPLDGLVIHPEVGMVIADGIQDLSNFFLAHDVGGQFCAAGGMFAVSLTQNLDRLFLFLDFALDTAR